MIKTRRNSSIMYNPLEGAIFIIVALILLVVNEIGYIKNTKITNFAKKAVNVSDLTDSNNNKLVHVMGALKTDDVITDGLISVNALVLSREIEEYKQVREKRGDSYTTVNKWEYGGSFVYRDNEKDLSMSSITRRAQNIHLGPFELGHSVKEQLKAESDYRNLPFLPESNLYLSGGMYVSNNNSSPQLGDVRISYKYLPSDINYSIIAKQNGKILEADKKQGADVLIVQKGLVSKTDMIKHFSNNNELWTNVKRLLAFLFIWIALNNMIIPIQFVFSLMKKNSGVLQNLQQKEIFSISVIIYLGLTALVWLKTNLILSVLLGIIIGIIYYYVFNPKKA